jgi:flagellar biosynthesis/type III secretory pathway chaperone
MLYLFLKQNDVVTKEQMLEHLGWDSKKDRQLRDLLSLIGKKRPLISTSDSKGYKIAKTQKDIEEVEHTLAEMSSRVEEIQKRMQPLYSFRDLHKFGIGD